MIKNLLSDDEPESKASAESRSGRTVQTLFDSDGPADNEPFVISEAQPVTTEETIRRTGLAWSAGAAFGGAVIFMLILGWGADVLLGSSPWGIVGGILLGSIIGFVQFFRLSSQIFKK